MNSELEAQYTAWMNRRNKADALMGDIIRVYMDANASNHVLVMRAYMQNIISKDEFDLLREFY